MNQNLVFFLKTSFVYGVLAASFSFIGVFLPEKQYLDSPLASLTVEHVLGHILFGAAAGAASLGLRYLLVGGAFAIILDSDHLIQLLGIEAMARMGHSVPFATISAIGMMLIFGKKNYVLGAVAFAGVLAHISFDTFTNGSGFPFFTPFFNQVLFFHSADWIFFELAAIVLVGSIAIQVKRVSMKKEI